MASPTRPSPWPPLALALAFVVVSGLTGCGGDDGGPTRPNGPQTPSSFDQVTALSQAQAATPQAVVLVESMTALAGGVGKDAGKSYGWNAETQRWEYDHTTSAAGYDYEWFYTVQYLDGEGLAQQFVSGAATVLHDMTGTGAYSGTFGEATVEYDYNYRYSTTVTGLATGTLTLDGTGGWDFDYRYRSPQTDFDQRYEVSWQVLPPGIVRATGGGCPTGTIRYDFPPYYSLVTFSGGDTATSVLYAADGTPVPGGSSTSPVRCTP